MGLLIHQVVVNIGIVIWTSSLTNAKLVETGLHVRNVINQTMVISSDLCPQIL